MERNTVSVRVWGDYACFSRPDFKVERVSYPVMTPSAARGVLEAIFWKPEMRYEIRRIGILQQGSQVVVLRNELSDRVSDRQIQKPIVIERERQQRTSLVLKNVEYLIEAVVILRPHATDPIAKYLAQIERRLDQGQYHHAPYLGTREFAAGFAAGTGQAPPELDFWIGLLLFDIAFIPSQTRTDMSFKVPGRAQPTTGYHQALYLEHGKIERGWLNVPREKYQELYRLEAADV